MCSPFARAWRRVRKYLQRLWYQSRDVICEISSMQTTVVWHCPQLADSDAHDLPLCTCSVCLLETYFITLIRGHTLYSRANVPIMILAHGQSTLGGKPCIQYGKQFFFPNFTQHHVAGEMNPHPCVCLQLWALGYTKISWRPLSDHDHRFLSVSNPVAGRYSSDWTFNQKHAVCDMWSAGYRIGQLSD